MSKPVLNFEALECAVMYKEPYVWGIVEPIIRTQALANALAVTFPSTGYHDLVCDQGPKPYRLNGRALPPEHELTPPWLDLVNDIQSDRYRQALGKLIGLDLRSMQMEVTLWRNDGGSYLTPHTDKPNKVVTHVLYLTSKYWRHENGGHFMVLGSQDPTDVVAEVAPKCGRSIIIVRSDTSWHAVRPVLAGSMVRCSVQVTLYSGVLQYSKPFAVNSTGPSV